MSNLQCPNARECVTVVGVVAGESLLVRPIVAVFTELAHKT
jgi:hypothetical protein